MRSKVRSAGRWRGGGTDRKSPAGTRRVGPSKAEPSRRAQRVKTCTPPHLTMTAQTESNRRANKNSHFIRNDCANEFLFYFS